MGKLIAPLVTVNVTILPSGPPTLTEQSSQFVTLNVTVLPKTPLAGPDNTGAAGVGCGLGVLFIGGVVFW
jgi:hypothetical protein